MQPKTAIREFLDPPNLSATYYTCTYTHTYAIPQLLNTQFSKPLGKEGLDSRLGLGACTTHVERLSGVLMRVSHSLHHVPQVTTASKKDIHVICIKSGGGCKYIDRIGERGNCWKE